MNVWYTSERFISYNTRKESKDRLRRWKSSDSLSLSLSLSLSNFMNYCKAKKNALVTEFQQPGELYELFKIGENSKKMGSSDRQEVNIGKKGIKMLL
jgi:hypothetical protein